MAEMHSIYSSLSPSNPDMDISNAPSALESPTISLTNPSSPSPVPQENDERAAHGICVHDADAYLDEGQCSISSYSEMEAVRQHVYANGDTRVDEQVLEGDPLHDDQELNQMPHSEERGVDDAYSGQPGLDSSGSDADVEKGWGSSKAKQVDGDEEGQGECCRVCQLTVGSAGDVIKLGCACKDDLALAHQRCAETWFKIKGNRTCEICGSTARNILGNGDANFVEQWNDAEASHLGPTRAERCWQNQPLCNTLLVCVLLVLIASWLFRVTLF